MDPKTTSERLAEAMARTRRQWQRKAAAEPEPGAPAAPVCPAFTIALSRDAGANGSLIARALGERLGWPVYDRELLQRIAGDLGLQASLLEDVDEKCRGWMQHFLEAFASGPAVNEIAYARRLLESLLSLAAHGECVIVGRGAAQVLPAVTTLRIRLVGPLDDRIEVMRRRHGISHDEAARRVATTDAERVRFVKDHFRQDPADPRHYDLTINSSRFSVAECVDLIVAALQKLQSRATAKATA